VTEPTETWRPPVEEPHAEEPPAKQSPASQPAATAVRPSLPGSATAAAIILFVFAVLAGLASVVMLLSGAIYDQIPNTGTGLSEDQFRSAMAMGRVIVMFFGIAGLLVAAAHVLSGIGIIRRAGWGRILGIVIASLGVLLTALILLVVVIGLTQPTSPATLAASGMTEEQYRAVAALGFVIVMVMMGGALLCYLFVLVALIRTGSAFR